MVRWLNNDTSSLLSAMVGNGLSNRCKNEKQDNGYVDVRVVDAVGLCISSAANWSSRWQHCGAVKRVTVMVT
jgi:hypothetical protein